MGVLCGGQPSHLFLPVPHRLAVIMRLSPFCAILKRFVRAQKDIQA